MGAVSGMLGTAGGAAGTGFNNPQQAQIDRAVTSEDVKQGQTGTNQSLAQQQALLAALQGQGGLQAQSAAQAQQQALANHLEGGAQNLGGAATQQRILNAQLAASNGVGTQNAAIQGLQGVASQYGNIAAGQGPNPALAMLHQQTGQNVANQAALMAGQRGAGANVGLLARQAAQQGAATQQQAVGQGASLQAQQQLNALLGLQSTQQAIGGLGSTQVGMQHAGIGQYGNIAQQQVAAQQAAQNAAAQQANQIANQQISGTNAVTQANMANTGQLQGALGAENSAVTSSQGNVNQANSGLAQTQMGGQQSVVGGLAKAASALGGLAHGGTVHHYATGDIVSTQVAGPQSSFGQQVSGNDWQAGLRSQQTLANANPQPQDNSSGQGLTRGQKDLQEGVSALGVGLGKAINNRNNIDIPSTGESLAGQDSSEMGEIPMTAAKGGLASHGGDVKAKDPSEKAVKSGDSYANDKVPAMLSEGEIVIPRSVLQSQDPAGAAAQFVREHLAKKKSSPVKMAEGGDVGDEEEQQAPQEAPAASPQQAPAEQAPAQPQEAQAPAAPVAPQEQAPLTPEQSAQQKLQDYDNLHQDLRFGRIHPKTYSDMFSKNADGSEKSTLGKIGTIFGLLLGGAGAGLTHSSNTLLDMWNKEIERDVEAQKTDQSNKQNWYKIALQREQNEPINALNKTLAESGGLDTDTKRWAANLKGITDFSATNRAVSESAIASIAHQQNLIDSMPNGPLKQKYQTIMDTSVMPTFTNWLSQKTLGDERKAALMRAANPFPATAQKKMKKAADTAQEPGSFVEPIDVEKKSALIKQGVKTQQDIVNGDKYTSISPDAAKALAQEETPLRSGAQNYSHWADSFQKVMEMPGAGQVPAAGAVKGGITALGGILGSLAGPLGVAGGAGAGNVIGRVAGETAQQYFERNRQIQVNSLKEKLRRGGMGDDAVDHLISSIMPTWTDMKDPDKLKEIALKGKQYWESMPEMQGTLHKQYGLYKGIPNYKFKFPKIESEKSDVNESARLTPGPKQ
jgi:hypothetical protein